MSKNIDCVEKVQRCAARFVCQDFQRTSSACMSVATMMNSLCWESLAERMAKAKVVMLHVHRAINGLVALPITNSTPTNCVYNNVLHTLLYDSYPPSLILS